MRTVLLRLKGIAIAIVALALSASLAFGASPPDAASFGLDTAAGHAGKTVPAAGGVTETTGEGEEAEEPEDGEEPEEGDEEEEGEDEESEEAGENCLTDPTTLTVEDLAELSHGSIVCWAAHQETPEGYKNHGEWVSEWAHFGKGAEADDDTDEDATEGDGEEADEDEDTDEAKAGKGHGQSKGKVRGKNRS